MTNAYLFSGGLGKAIALTSVVKHSQKIKTLLCSFPVVFENNPHLRVLKSWPAPFQILI